MAEPTDPKKPDAKSAKDDKPEPKKASSAPKAKPSQVKSAAAKAGSAASKDKTEQVKPTSSAGMANASAASTSSSTASSTQTKSSSVPGTSPAKPSSEANSSGAGGSGRFVLWLVVIIVLAGGGAYVTKDVWLPMAQPHLANIPGMGGGVQTAPKDEASPVEVLDERISALEQKLASSAENDGAMATLKAEKDRVQAEMNKALARISDLERRLKEVRELAQAVTSSSGGDIDLSPVMSRIDQLEDSGRRTTQQLAVLANQVDTGMQASAANNGDGKASGLILAIAQLRDTALSGQPYAAQLNAFRILASDNTDYVAAASRLTVSADSGLPTSEELSDSFNDVAGDIISLARSQDGDWLEQAAARMSSLVSIRRTDGQSGDPVEDAVAEIETRLSARDVPGAVQVASGLSDILTGEARTLLEGWLLDAKMRASAERALNAIHTSALAGLGG